MYFKGVCFIPDDSPWPKSLTSVDFCKISCGILGKPGDSDVLELLVGNVTFGVASGKLVHLP